MDFFRKMIGNRSKPCKLKTSELNFSVNQKKGQSQELLVFSWRQQLTRSKKNLSSRQTKKLNNNPNGNAGVWLAGTIASKLLN